MHAPEPAGEPITAAGIEDLKAELSQLEGPARLEMAARIKTAREEGDLGEPAIPAVKRLCKRGDAGEQRLAAGHRRTLECAILRIRRTEFAWALAAFAGVILLGTLKGILIAIVLSLMALAYQVANPPVHVLGRKPGTNVFRPRSKEHPEDESFPGLLILRPEGRIFFVNAERIGGKMRALADEAKPKVVALDMSAVFDLEYTALKMLIEGEKREREAGIDLWLVDLNPDVLRVVQRSSLGETLGRERMLFNLEVAVERYQTRKGR